MVDEVKEIRETADSKAAAEALDRARIAREKREAEQRKRLEELRAHAAAAQAQREKRDEERRKRQAEQRARDDDRRQQVEERKRAIWEASVNRREALLARERERTERLERARASRSSPRSAFAFGSSTPRLLEPVDSAGFFWAARSTNPIDQMNFFDSLAASTTNVMFASAPLTRRASALHLDSETDNNKDEPDRSPQTWSSVARRRTDLVPTLPAPRAPEARSGDTTPTSRPGSALSSTPVVRRPQSTPRRPRPASIAGTGVNTPRGMYAGPGLEAGGASTATTPGVSRDSTSVARRPRPLSVHVAHHVPAASPGEGKPPIHRKPKPSKDIDKSAHRKSLSVSPGRTISPAASKESSVDKDIQQKIKIVPPTTDKSLIVNQVNAQEVTQKLEALRIQNGDKEHTEQKVDSKPIENGENVTMKSESNHEQTTDLKVPELKVDVPKPVEKKEEKVKEEAKQKKEEIREKKEELKEKKEETKEKKENSQERGEENEMTASMSGRRITTEEEAKAALAERRRRAREELERQAELERQRLEKEAEEEAERLRQEEERQRREEEEARELAELQRKMEEEKLRKAIEAQQQLEKEEAERKAREEVERQARLKEDEEKRKAAEEAERLRREEAEREEKERLARKQRVEAIMARTRLRKAEEDKKQAENKQVNNSSPNNGNENTAVVNNSQSEHKTEPEKAAVPNPASNPAPAVVSSDPSNGNGTDLSQHNHTEDKPEEQSPNAKPVDITPTIANMETNNGNIQSTNVGHISANFIQTERENGQKMAENGPKLIEDDFTTHNGHNHPLMQNAI